MRLRISPPLTEEKIRDVINAQILTQWTHKGAKFQPKDLARVITVKWEYPHKKKNVIDDTLKQLHNSLEIKGEIGIVVAASSPDDKNMRGGADRGPMFGYARRDYTRYYLFFPKFNAIQGVHSHLLEKVDDPELRRKLVSDAFGEAPAEENEEQVSSNQPKMSGRTETGTWKIKDGMLILNNSGYVCELSKDDIIKLLAKKSVNGYRIKNLGNVYSGPGDDEVCIASPDEMHYCPREVLQRIARSAYLDPSLRRPAQS